MCTVSMVYLTHDHIKQIIWINRTEVNAVSSSNNRFDIPPSNYSIFSEIIKINSSLNSNFRSNDDRLSKEIILSRFVIEMM